MRAQIHTLSHTNTHTHTYISPNTHTHWNTLQTVILSCRALSLDAQAHFAAMNLSRSPCCHAAAVRSTHYFLSCDSISESFCPGSWTKRGGGGTSQPLLNSDDRENEKKQSPCPSMDYIRNSTNVNHALISVVLQRLLCRKYSVWSSTYNLFWWMQAGIDMCTFMQ